MSAFCACSVFQAGRSASTHQRCSGSLTGGSAATCTRHDVAATTSCNAAARRPGARPRRLARRPGWREASESCGAGRRSAHGDAAGSRLRRGPKPAGRVVQRVEFEALRAGLLCEVRQGESRPADATEARPSSNPGGNEEERRRLPPGGLEGVVRRPPRVLRAAGLPVHDGAVREPLQRLSVPSVLPSTRNHRGDGVGNQTPPEFDGAGRHGGFDGWRGVGRHPREFDARHTPSTRLPTQTWASR